VRPVSGSERFPFVQLELAGSVGLDEARYLAREPDERVLVVRTANAMAPPRRRLRRRRPREIEPDPQQPTLPVTTLTVIRPVTLGTSDEAGEWLERMRADGEAVMDEIAAATTLINSAIAGQQAASLDPYLADLSAEHAQVVRIGYGPGERVADGRWERAVEVPRGERRRRAEVLRPQETIAALLAGRESIPASIPLLLRARADLDAGRAREAALQLRLGLDALLGELSGESALPTPVPGAGAPGELAARHEADLGELTERRGPIAEVASDALRDDLGPARIAELAETLAICERVLRRRRAYGR
jgi:hypothetical protein